MNIEDIINYFAFSHVKNFFEHPELSLKNRINFFNKKIDLIGLTKCEMNNFYNILNNKVCESGECISFVKNGSIIYGPIFRDDSENKNEIYYDVKTGYQLKDFKELKE